MLKLLLYRLAYMAITLLLVSIVTFVIIQLPPGDFVDAYISRMSANGSAVSAEEAQSLRKLYGSNVGENALHGSDSPETAKGEIAYFFAGYELSPLG